MEPLIPTMSLREFENGNWYLEQLKTFAERIGIPDAKKLRNDELEKAISAFLRTGKAIRSRAASTQRTATSFGGTPSLHQLLR
jgi:hypothetical protein